MIMKKIFRLRVLVILVVMVIFGYSIKKQEDRLRDQRNEIEKLKQQEHELTKEYLDYRDEASNEDEHVMKQLREKWDYIKENEIMVKDKNQ